MLLDRPNPLGDSVDGSVTEAGLESFVGCCAIPVRYGLTCGEFARMINEAEALHCDLHVVPCSGLSRGMCFPDWERDWINPSPNLRSYDAALLYPGTCLFEGTNCSEGRGTAEPFAIIGAPFVQAARLYEAFSALQLPGVTARPVEFTPDSSKHQGIRCEGLHLQVANASRLQSAELGIHLMDLMRRLFPEDFRILPPQPGDTIPFISRLAGHRAFEA